MGLTCHDRHFSDKNITARLGLRKLPPITFQILITPGIDPIWNSGLRPKSEYLLLENQNSLSDIFCWGSQVTIGRVDQIFWKTV